MGETSLSEVCFNHLSRLYSEEHRAYHNLTHIEACLDIARTMVPSDADHTSLNLAIWYHDAIYDPKGKDSEEQSAALFEKHALLIGTGQPIVPLVREAILATKHTASVTTDANHVVQYMLDVDLSILGANPEEYDLYDAAIRKEYAWVPDEAYVAGRRAILQGFLDRERIYLTPLFHRLDANARTNLRRSVARLTPPV